MGGFFTDTHEQFPEPVRDPKDQSRIALTFEGQVPSVSFSTMSSFENCPYAVYLSKVHNGGIKPVGSPAMDRGSAIHEALELYVNGTNEDMDWLLPKSKNYYSPIIERFRTSFDDGKVVPELQLAFRKDMSECGWFDKDVWLRGAIDIAEFEDSPESSTHCTLYDYKTGSDRSAVKHRAQLMLYALLMFIKYPKLETIDTTAIYLDHKKELFLNQHTRNDLDISWPRYKNRLLRVTESETYYPEPNAYTCKWCQHKKAQEKLGQTEPACSFAFD